MDYCETLDPQQCHLSRRSLPPLSKDVRRVFRLADAHRRACRAQGQGTSPITPDPSCFPSVAVAQPRPNRRSPTEGGRTFCHPPETPVPWLSPGTLEASRRVAAGRVNASSSSFPAPRSRSRARADPLLPAFPGPTRRPNHRIAIPKNPLIYQAPRRGSVAVRAGPKPGVDGVPYVATNRFVVPDKDPEVVRRLVSEIESREKLMKTLPGYTSSALASGPGEGEFSFTQEWETKQAYEDYMNHPQRRRSHMAAGVYQYLPKDKWSVPENFTPILPTPK